MRTNILLIIITMVEKTTKQEKIFLIELGKNSLKILSFLSALKIRRLNIVNAR